MWRSATCSRSWPELNDDGGRSVEKWVRAANLSARSVTPGNVGVRILYGALPTVVVTSAGELEPSPHLRGR